MHRQLSGKPIAARWAANGKPNAAFLLFAWDGAQRALGFPGAVLFFTQLGINKFFGGANAEAVTQEITEAIQELTQ